MGVNAELVKLMGPQLELLLPELDEKVAAAGAGGGGAGSRGRRDHRGGQA